MNGQEIADDVTGRNWPNFYQTISKNDDRLSEKESSRLFFWKFKHHFHLFLFVIFCPFFLVSLFFLNLNPIVFHAVLLFVPLYPLIPLGQRGWHWKKKERRKREKGDACRPLFYALLLRDIFLSIFCTFCLPVSFCPLVLVFLASRPLFGCLVPFYPFGEKRATRKRNRQTNGQ